MEGHTTSLLRLASCLLFFFILSNPSLLMVRSQILQVVDEDGGRGRMQTYIVYVEKAEGLLFLSHQDQENWHKSFLPRSSLDSDEPRLVYSYQHSISGFAARLTPEEVKAMEGMDGFLHAEPDRTRPLATTYTPEFLGLRASNGAWSSSNGEGVIIGVLDTGILPTHPSFNPAGMPPPPATWKGSCQFKNFSCNNKIIGGAAFHGQDKQNPSPLDDAGHGTHVAGTAAGSIVYSANVIGSANGTASGVAPKAHLAIYKVCFTEGCRESDILAGIDKAINDGVDLITMSLGGRWDTKFYIDSVALGSLSAVRHGIVTITSSGNLGPGEKTLAHSAPWLLTVGSASTDRRIEAVVKLGNGVELVGESAYQPGTFNSSAMLPIVYPGSDGNLEGTGCLDGSLDNLDVKGKLVLCSVGNISPVEKGRVVSAAGGAAMVVMNAEAQGYTTAPDAHVFPASNVNFRDGEIISAYFDDATANNFVPEATIAFQGTKFGYRPSPGVASTSSRGPSNENGGILKPDIIAPGVNILAAWPFAVGPNPAGSSFIFLSGTSMATPHVAGAVALMKSKYRSWSPAAIQSALITTAHGLDLNGNDINDESTGEAANVFDIGAGLVDPSAALHPGLVYDLAARDYVGYLCGLGYSDFEVTAMVGRRVSCRTVRNIKPWQLNYPSIGVNLGPDFNTTSIKRTVTNVGDPNSLYTARITEPNGIKVSLTRKQIRFTPGKKTSTFTVKLTLTIPDITDPKVFQGKLEWISEKHIVTSPIAIMYTP